MNDRSILRLTAVWVVVLSLLVTLIARLFYMQVIAHQTYVNQASAQAVRTILTTAPRGMILDQLGRPLVDNRTSMVVTVDPNVLARQADGGKAVLNKLGPLLHIKPKTLKEMMLSCGAPGSPPHPICWPGSTFEPVTIKQDVSSTLALQIMENRQEFPGVTAGLQAVRNYEYPYGVNMAHVLGYLGPMSQNEISTLTANYPAGQVALSQTDLVGQAGLESVYNKELEGKPGITTLAVDQAGIVRSTVKVIDPTPGNYVISTIDARVQSVAETQLAQAIQRARASGYVGDSGAVVVMDVHTGNILALASWPTYDPKIWVGGISTKDYNRLVSTKANTPLLNRATQGAWAPASTFKIVTTSAAAKAGYGLYNTYPCTSSIVSGGRTFTNYHGESFGDITLARALEVSCDTVFYGIAQTMWNAAGGNNPKHRTDPIATMAGRYGFGHYTGIDLPGESPGVVGGRMFKYNYWVQNRKAICYRASHGYPEVKDRATAALWKAYAISNCASGYVYYSGDELNLSIGQGDTAVTPIQEAVAYSAVANGGKLMQPRLVKGIESPTGKIIKEFKPVVRGKVPVPPEVLAYLRNALMGVTTVGTAAYRFTDYPNGSLPIAAKTGTGEVAGRDYTSWFSTFAPGNKPQYEITMVVSQGGTGSGTCGPSVRRIYEALFGIKGQSIDAKRSVLVGGQEAKRLPAITSTGIIKFPGWQQGAPTRNYKLATTNTNAVWDAPFIPGLPKGTKD